MKIRLVKNHKKDIRYDAVDSLGSSGRSISFKKFPANKPAEIDPVNRYLTLKVPPGEGFKINPKSKTIFEFIQMFPKHPEFDDHDIYVFQVIKFGAFSEEALGGVDGDIDPPNPEFPLG